MDVGIYRLIFNFLRCIEVEKSKAANIYVWPKAIIATTVSIQLWSSGILYCNRLYGSQRKLLQPPTSLFACARVQTGLINGLSIWHSSAAAMDARQPAANSAYTAFNALELKWVCIMLHTFWR